MVFVLFSLQLELCPETYPFGSQAYLSVAAAKVLKKAGPEKLIPGVNKAAVSLSLVMTANMCEITVKG